MFSSQKLKNVILEIYNDSRTVFRLNDIALLVSESNFQSLNRKLNYYVRTGKLLNPRKGIYAKQGFNSEELACILFTPCYLSLEYVLLKNGIIFQYDQRMTLVSYLSRTVQIGNQVFIYRKLQDKTLVNIDGINRQNNQINTASPERAFLDILYLNGDYYFDNLNPINKQMVFKLLPIYNSKVLVDRAKKILKNG